MYEGCKENIKEGSIILFEGGSNTRDSVTWMVNLKKRKINDIKKKVNYTLLTPDQKYSLSIIYNPKLYNLEI